MAKKWQSNDEKGSNKLTKGEDKVNLDIEKIITVSWANQEQMSKLKRKALEYKVNQTK